jgi:branched-chain amino acid transport system substrate-binding protein
VGASNLFICYRRDDTAPYAGRLYEDLRRRFSDHDVFMDLRIDLGEDFVEQVEEAIESCAVLLVLIGPDWLDIRDEHGSPRLGEPDDFVRLEIATALERGVLVIPLLVRGARMPRAHELPAALAPLVRRTGLSMRDDRWDDDVGRLVRTLTPRLEKLPPATPSLALAPAITPDLPGLKTPPDLPGLKTPPDLPALKTPPAAERKEKRPSLWRQLVSIIGSRFRVAIGALVLLTAAVALYLMFIHDPRATVKVGALYALSGVTAAADQEVFDGVQFAMHYVNDADDPGSTLPLTAGAGLPNLDAKLELVKPHAVPNRCTTDAVFDRFVDNDHVAAVVGAFESTVTLRAIVAADRRRIPLVNGGSTVTALTDPRDRAPRLKTCRDATEPDPRPSPWFFRVGPNDRQAAKQFFALIGEARRSGKIRRVRKVAILHENRDAYGNGAAADTRKEANLRDIKSRSFKYKTVLGAPASMLDTSSCSDDEHKLVSELDERVGDLKRYKPDIVFAVSYPFDAIAVVQTMREHDYVPPVLLAYGMGYLGKSFITDAAAGNAACGLRGVDPTGIVAHAAWSADISEPNTTAKRIAQLFEQRTKRPMNARSALGFTAMMTLAQAINAARSTEPRKIQAALRALEVPRNATIMPWDGIEFDKKRQNRGARFVLQQLIARRYRVVYPSDNRTARAILPGSNARE